ncbi:branched-chain amino acid--2-keto-4-methylthiobutyrate aminotransferase [Starkeya sp. ORNL1]|uniref:aminotransferase class IV n=1 Tax=Starkeya sp. ORNL1 TaxID=2709380 RepID=UPI0014632871|nr:aminotransferase class IV [Starkeya sp. ORNL1]QJP16995.1 branched-chain amino acid--2-keto-4-methylthiobutyrate aminotransferase [Starkeya sp. ORNL1]
MTEAKPDYSKGAAYINGEFVPIAEAKIPVGDWGFTHSDVTYDVVHVTDGGFFRLEDHLDRFHRSLEGYRLKPPVKRDEMREILGRCVALSGLRDAFVAMVSTRGIPRIYGSRDPEDCDNTFIGYAVPWVDVIKPDVQARGAHLLVASVPRISQNSLDPTLKNYMWRDFTRGMYEARDKGFDTAILLDSEGYLTEGAGFNVFIVKGNAVLTPDRGSLRGITRLSVLDLCPELGLDGRVAPITFEELMDADEVFTATTAGGVMPCSRVNERIYGNDRPGPISQKLKDLYWQKHKEGWHMTPVNYADAENPFSVAA